MVRVLWALGVQLGVFGVLVILVSVLPWLVAPPYPHWPFVLIQAGLSAWVVWRLAWPRWWVWIQVLFPVLLFVALMSEFNAMWGLLLFVLLWLVFFNAGKERVPLYLTNNTTRQALVALVQQVLNRSEGQKSDVAFLDLGSGLGGNVRAMSNRPEVSKSIGVETAPIPLLVSKLLSVFLGGEVWAKDLWKTDLAKFDVVYAFLSPEPMPRLWEKVTAEMRPGTVFVSNSFVVPGQEPTEVWELEDARQTRLYIYQL